MYAMLWALMLFSDPIEKDKLPIRYLPAVQEVLQAAIKTGDFKTPADFTGPYELYVGTSYSGPDIVVFSWIHNGDRKYLYKDGQYPVRTLGLGLEVFPTEHQMRVKQGNAESGQILMLDFDGMKLLVELYYPNRDAPRKYLAKPVQKSHVKNKPNRRKSHRRPKQTIRGGLLFVLTAS